VWSTIHQKHIKMHLIFVFVSGIWADEPAIYVFSYKWEFFLRNPFSLLWWRQTLSLYCSSSDDLHSPLSPELWVTSTHLGAISSPKDSLPVGRRRGGGELLPNMEVFLQEVVLGSAKRWDRASSRSWEIYGWPLRQEKETLFLKQ